MPSHVLRILLLKDHWVFRIFPSIFLKKYKTVWITCKGWVYEYNGGAFTKLFKSGTKKKKQKKKNWYNFKRELSRFCVLVLHRSAKQKTTFICRKTNLNEEIFPRFWKRKTSSRMEMEAKIKCDNIKITEAQPIKAVKWTQTFGWEQGQEKLPGVNSNPHWLLIPCSK